MINAIKIFLLGDTGKSIDLVVGEGDVKKIFIDKEKPDTVVVLTTEEIFEYGNCSYIAFKSYKADKAEVKD